jgi:hypothetical protein
MKTRITYPYLLECCNYTNDAYWKSIFTNLSCGIPPHGVYIHKDFLVCNYKDKAFSYKLLQKNPEEIFSDVYKLFKTKLQMFSRDDILQKQDEIDGLTKKIVYSGWGDIKRKNIKDTLIENFVLDQKNKYALTYSQTRDLLNIINIGLIFKYITYKDIIIVDGKITEISCIVFGDDCIFKYTRDIFTHTDGRTPPPIVFKSDTSISKEWDRYVSFYKKLYAR